MKKYRSVMKAYLRGSLMNLMEYKFNFIAGGTFELVWTAMYVLFIDVVFTHTETINGWNRYQTLMLTFQGGLMDSAFTLLIVPGLRRLPEMVNTGSLDFILLKPINKRFNISFQIGRYQIQSVSRRIEDIHHNRQSYAGLCRKRCS